jgi:hypothetical protein
MGLTRSIAHDINDSSIAALEGNKPGGTSGYVWNPVQGGLPVGGDPIYQFGANFGINNSNNVVGYNIAGFDGGQAIYTQFNGAGWDVGVEIGPQAVR